MVWRTTASQVLPAGRYPQLDKPFRHWCCHGVAVCCCCAPACDAALRLPLRPAPQLVPSSLSPADPRGLHGRVAAHGRASVLQWFAGEEGAGYGKAANRRRSHRPASHASAAWSCGFASSPRCAAGRSERPCHDQCHHWVGIRGTRTALRARGRSHCAGGVVGLPEVSAASLREQHT
mgnify:CR=1 FL=1